MADLRLIGFAQMLYLNLYLEHLDPVEYRPISRGAVAATWKLSVDTVDRALSLLMQLGYIHRKPVTDTSETREYRLIWRRAESGSLPEYVGRNVRARRGLSRPSLKAGQRFRILSRDGFRCRYCGRGAPEVELHVDHVLARARGGSDDDANLTAACGDCNKGKGASELPDIAAVAS